MNPNSNVTELLQQTKAQLEASNATIAEIQGDTTDLKTKNTELQTTNTELQEKVAELTSQQPNNELISEIAGLVNTQGTTLRSIADIHQKIETGVPSTGGEQPSGEGAVSA